MARSYFLRVGGEAPRGPLTEDAIRDALRSGVIGDGAEVAETSDGPFVPVRDVLGAVATTTATAAPAKKRRALVVGGAIIGAILLLGAVGGGVAHWMSTRPAKLCAATPKLLASLREQLLIEAYVTRGTPELDKSALEIDRLLRAYADAGKGHVVYRLVEVKTEDDRKRAKEVGLQAISSGDEKEHFVAMAYLGIAFTYGAEKDTIKLLPPGTADGLEFWVTNKIRELHARGDHTSYRVGVVTGTSEIALDEPNILPSGSGRPAIGKIITQYFPFYSLPKVEIGKLGDEQLDGLIVTQPGRDLTASELHAIDAFAMRGKPVAIVASAANVRASDATMTPTLATHGLEKLLAGWGVTMHADVALDADASWSAASIAQSGPSKLGAPFVPLVKPAPDGALDASSPVFFRLPEVAFPFASSLDFDAGKQPGAAFRVLAKTSKGTSILTRSGVSLSPFTKAPSQPASGPVTIALSIEGRLTSAFDAGVATPNARVLVVSSSGFFTNPFARAGNGPDTGQTGMMMPTGGDEPLLKLAAPYAQAEVTNTILVLKNLLDWLSLDDDLGACTSATITKKK